MIYECAYCHEKYSEPNKRTECESKCYNKIMAEQERQRKEKLEQERASRWKALTDDYDKLIDDMMSYYKDYGNFDINGLKRRCGSKEQYETHF